MTTARLIVADSERSADMFYATRFLAPDPFIFAQVNGRKFLVMSDLELDRARAQARVDEVLSYTKLHQAAKNRGIKEPTMSDVIDEFFKPHTQVHRLSVINP